MGLNDFEKLYGFWEDYPQCLTTAGALGQRRGRQYQALNTPTLFVQDEFLFKVPFRDFSLDGTVHKLNCLSERALDERLRRWNQDAIDRKDPQCRFVFLVNADRGKPLEINKTGLQKLLTYHQVQPMYLDILNVYNASWADERELRFSTFRSNSVLSNPQKESIVQELGRTGHQYQMCFNLKVPVLRHYPQDNKDIYKIRQAALHHQFDVGSGMQVWIIGDPHAIVKGRIQNLFPKDSSTRSAFTSIETSFKSSLRVHLDLIRWATEEWRDYIEYIEREVEDNTRDIINQHRLSLDERIGQSHGPPTIGQIQDVEDETNKALMVLQANNRIITALAACYEQLVQDNEFELLLPPQEHLACKQYLKRFQVELDELKSQLQMQVDHANVLKSTVDGRKNMLIQELNSEATETTKALTASMWQQAERNAKEAIMMRIITVITLIYLPPTFTSTWFSMDIVKYQSEAGEREESLSTLALGRWLSVSLPLLFITATGAYFWWRREEGMAVQRTERERKRFPRAFPLDEEIKPRLRVTWLVQSAQLLRHRFSLVGSAKRAVGQSNGKSDVELSSMKNGLGVETEAAVESPRREPADTV